MVNVHEGNFDYITVRGRFDFIYQSLIVWEKGNGLRGTVDGVLVIHVLMLQVILFEIFYQLINGHLIIDLDQS